MCRSSQLMQHSTQPAAVGEKSSGDVTITYSSYALTHNRSAIQVVTTANMKDTRPTPGTQSMPRGARQRWSCDVGLMYEVHSCSDVCYSKHSTAIYTTTSQAPCSIQYTTLRPVADHKLPDNEADTTRGLSVSRLKLAGQQHDVTHRDSSWSAQLSFKLNCYFFSRSTVTPDSMLHHPTYSSLLQTKGHIQSHFTRTLSYDILLLAPLCVLVVTFVTQVILEVD